uniref:Uncharacterized protein n=1 Tax=Panagrolaimus superbus TaxID=310955 RepID=A0A914YR40_9BILA
MVQTDKNGSKMLVQTASEFYEKEEAIAKTFTNDKIMKDSYELFQKYRNVVQDHLQKDIPFNKNDVIHLQALVAQLRGLNRRSNLRTKLKSDTVEVKRKEVEKKHLTMQNLEMELEHLHRSIDDLKAVEFTHIDLVSSEECMQQKGISIETFNEMTEHDQQMALLSLELELRKELVKNIETMKSQVVEKEQKLEEKERKLDALLPQVNQIRKLTQPILTSLELHTVTTAHLERTNRSRYLAPQLSSLYVNVTVYNKVNEGSTLKFTCTGKIEEAIAFEQTQKEENNLKRQKSHIDEPTEMIVSEDEEESENEELMDIDRMPDSRTHREKEEEILNDFKKKQKLFTPHPISFTTSIPIPGDEAHSSNLVFNYLPQLDVVTVKPVIKLKPSFEPFMSAETILDEIYPGDSGQDLFNTSAAMLLSIAGAKIDEISSTLGRPYKFAQQFCLVPDEKENDECRHDRFKYFLKTMLRIGDRIKARSVLDVTCRNATALKPLDSLPEDFKKLIPTRGVCALTSFKSIKSEEVLSTDLLSSRQQLIISKLSESGQLQNGFQFIAGISHDGNDRVYALIHIPRAYPENGSSSMILLVPANEEKFEYMAGLEALETYLNIEVPKLAEKEPELMFAFQLALLATRCEVVHDVSERDTNLQYKPVNFYLNYHSSRIHQPIFDFVPSRNAYGHTVTKAKPT